MCSFNKTTTDFRHSVAHSVCSLSLALIGTVGNATSIYLIWRGRLYNSRIMALLTNLCLADLILTAVILPLLSVNSFHTDWRYGDTFCQIFAYILFVTLSSEFLILILITINQYLIVVQNITPASLRHPGQRVKFILILFTPWLFSMTIYLLPLTGLWDQFGFDPRIHMCTLINMTGILGMKSTMSVSLLLGSTAVIFYCYLAIYCVHHRSQRKTAPSLHRQSTRGSWKDNKRNVQLIRMISVILVNFAITYMPFFIMYIADPCLNRTPSSAVVAIIYISMSHSATNPIIYALLNKQILAKWKEILFQCLNLRPRSPELDVAQDRIDDGSYSMKERNISP